MEGAILQLECDVWMCVYMCVHSDTQSCPTVSDSIEPQFHVL